MALGEPLEDSILKGSQEIVLPAFVSALCICIVFVPMFFLAGASVCAGDRAVMSMLQVAANLVCACGNGASGRRAVERDHLTARHIGDCLAVVEGLWLATP